MDPTKMTKQGIRDLNSYGPRIKPDAAEAVAVAEESKLPGVDATVPAGVAAETVAERAVGAPADGGAP